MKLLSVRSPFGVPVYYKDTVTSTMDEACVLAEAGAPSGTVIAAGRQTGGRGRTGRSWQSAKGNLFFTILLRFEAAIPEALTLRTGLAVSLAVEDAAPVLRGRVLVKWPNDVMIARPEETESGRIIPGPLARKTAGILTEARGTLVFIGIGVNVGQREFPAELRNKAASIAIEAGMVTPLDNVMPLDSITPPGFVLEKILARLHDELFAAPGDWRERLEGRLYMKGRRVRFMDGAVDSGRVVQGMLCGIGAAGELLIQKEGEGQARPFVSGELDVYGS